MLKSLSFLGSWKPEGLSKDGDLYSSPWCGSSDLRGGAVDDWVLCRSMNISAKPYLVSVWLRKSMQLFIESLAAS